jgi:hypothetical protein
MAGALMSRNCSLCPGRSRDRAERNDFPRSAGALFSNARVFNAKMVVHLPMLMVNGGGPEQ